MAQDQSPGTYRLNENAFLIQSCDNCTSVNISGVILGDKTNITLNAIMAEDNGFFWYTLNSTYVTYPGEYIASGIADPNGILTRWSYRFTVSQLAINQSTSQAIGSAIYLVLMVVLMFGVGFVGFKLAKSDTWWILGIFFMFFAWLLLVYNTFLGYQYHSIFTGLPDSGTPEIIFYILVLILVLGLLACTALLFLRWREVLKYMKKEIKRKEPNDEDLEDWDVDQWGGEDWRLRK